MHSRQQSQPSSGLETSPTSPNVYLGFGTLESGATAAWQTGTTVYLDNLLRYTKQPTGDSAKGLPQLFVPDLHTTAEAVSKTVSAWKDHVANGWEPESFDCPTSFDQNLPTSSGSEVRYQKSGPMSVEDHSRGCTQIFPRDWNQNHAISLILAAPPGNASDWLPSLTTQLGQHSDLAGDLVTCGWIPSDQVSAIPKSNTTTSASRLVQQHRDDTGYSFIPLRAQPVLQEDAPVICSS